MTDTTTTPLIDADAVDTLFRSLMFTRDEVPNGTMPKEFVKAEGITMTVAFHPQRLREAIPQIVAWLDALPDQFKMDGGGGWSFLNALDDKNGVQWTGLHERMAQLLMMGLAIGYAHVLLPREVWPALPGGMPYYQVGGTPTVVVTETT